MVEGLVYGAEGCWFDFLLGSTGDWKTLSANPVVDGYLFVQKKKRKIMQRKERDGFRLPYAVQSYSGSLTTFASTVTSLCETLTFKPFYYRCACEHGCQ